LFVSIGGRSASAHLAEYGADGLLGLAGLQFFAASLALHALHRRQKPGGFRLPE
jgi:hypothetical protein